MKRLKELASKYAEYATGKPMAQRREKWRRHNRLDEKTHPFHIEDNGTFFKDLTPPLQCESRECKGLESRLLHGITAYELIDDDRIIPDRFLIDWRTPTTGMCAELGSTHVDDGHGHSLGYKTTQPIKDIDADWGKLKHRTMTLDREATEKHAQLAKDVFDGLLPVEIGRASSFYTDGITNKAVHLMGMQEMYMQMAMNPEAVHRLFKFLDDDVMALGKWEEDNDLLALNNDGNQGYCSGSCYYTDETTEVAGEQVMASDRYGYLESQESVGISADMFDEFLMPHFTKAAPKFKLFKFGCCEPVHDMMPVLIRLPGLRKVTVTPWCDLSKLTETCPQDIIWSRKPIPLKLCGEEFVAEDLKAHLQETLDLGKDHFVEFVYRDTCLLTGDMKDRVDQTCAMIRDITNHPEGTRGC